MRIKEQQSGRWDTMSPKSPGLAPGHLPFLGPHTVPLPPAVELPLVVEGR
jgi:hypothetical protein